jgi:hypothetical protein
MKYLILFCSLLVASTISAQSDCHPYIPVSEGSTWEITNYSAKGKETGKIAYELLEKSSSGSDVTYKIKAITYDNKGEETFTTEFEAWCKGGQFQFDMAFKMDGSAMAAYENMDVDMDASEFELPSMNASAGTTLKDGTLSVQVGMNGATMFRMNVLVTDRLVESRESTDTPAGSFDCLVLSQRVSTKMIVKVEASSKEWYAKDVGMVRSESYNKKGKLTGYSELTKLNRK